MYTNATPPFRNAQNLVVVFRGQVKANLGIVFEEEAGPTRRGSELNCRCSPAPQSGHGINRRNGRGVQAHRESIGSRRRRFDTDN